MTWRRLCCRVLLLAAFLVGCGGAPTTQTMQVLGDGTFHMRMSMDHYRAQLREEARAVQPGARHGEVFATPRGGAARIVNLTGKAPHIGYIYRIEGYLNGQRVVYIGSAASVKQRLIRYGSQHTWKTLLKQKSTVIYTKKVYGKLDVKASGQGSTRSALNEALRSMEEPELQRAEKRAERENRRRASGQKRTKIGNARRAAGEPEMWQKRHNTTRDRQWRQIKRPGAGIKLSSVAGGALLLLIEGYRMYVEDKQARFVTTFYVLEDEYGAFTLYYEQGILNGLFMNKYYKRYIVGPYKGKKVPVSDWLWLVLKEEAKALWGTVDKWGNFVPGLLRPTLPNMSNSGAVA